MEVPKGIIPRDQIKHEIMENTSSLEHLIERESDALEDIKGIGTPYVTQKQISDVKGIVDDFLDMYDVDMPDIMYKRHFFGKLEKPLASIAWGIFYPVSTSYMGSAAYENADTIPAFEDPWYLVSLAVLGAVSAYTSLKLNIWDDANMRRIGTGWHNSNNGITLIKTRKETRLPVLAHEYVHEILKGKSQYDDNTAAFHEGFCRGVERHVAGKLAQRKKLFQQAVSLKCLDEYIKTSDWANGKQKNIHNHALGNSYFSLLELEHGKEIYRDILKAA